MSTPDLDDIPSNASTAPFQRRGEPRAVAPRFLKAGLGAGAVGFMGGLTACGSDDDDDSPPSRSRRKNTPQPKPVDLNFRPCP